ncbi:hypothetical protein MUA03_01375 [Enterobacteriaceae bacterium H16N7]|nr:hypothetical protein [Dryocola clanedunensis]
MLTKKEKAWFFLLCGKQAKINELIFLVIYSVRSLRNSFAVGFHQSGEPVCTGSFFMAAGAVSALLLGSFAIRSRRSLSHVVPDNVTLPEGQKPERFKPGIWRRCGMGVTQP